MDRSRDTVAGSARGISPPAAHRSVRESLDSYGSSQPCICLFRDQIFSGSGSSSWDSSWPSLPSSCVIPFAHRLLQAFQRYYGIIRPLQIHCYFPFSWVPLIGFRLALLEEFPSSIFTPRLDSSHLNTGHHMVDKQAFSMLILELSRRSSSDVV